MGEGDNMRRTEAVLLTEDSGDDLQAVILL